MDPADAFVYAYDTLSTCTSATLTGWQPNVSHIVDHVYADVINTGSLPDTWMPNPSRLVPTQELFGILCGSTAR
jgi:hypothetical protein